jgi:RHS repeat-associated protein
MLHIPQWIRSISVILVWIILFNMLPACGGGDPPGSTPGDDSGVVVPDGGADPDGAPIPDAGPDATLPDGGGPDTKPPVWPAGTQLTAASSGPTSARLTWSAATDDVGVTGYRIYKDGALLTSVAGGVLFASATGLTAGTSYKFKVEAGDAAGNWSTNGPEATFTPTIPDPSTVAPPIDRTVVTSFAQASAFLYTGPDPLQVGVAAGTIDPRRVAVIRGIVTDRAGAPMSGVTITIANHAEYGRTVTRADGKFDMAVNGGLVLAVNYAKENFIAIRHDVDVPWQDYVWAPDAALVPYDSQVTKVNLAAATDVEVARGSPVTDSSGTRQATVMFQQGTTAEMVLPNGSTQPLTSIDVRATEYTVGATGEKAMPGTLPPTSAYTYAAELSIDQAVQAGATEVRFNQPVPVYLDNFLNINVGTLVPSGFYDRKTDTWIASANGRVIRILTVGATVTIDVDGSGNAANAATLAALGITTGELQKLGTLYAAGKTLWRVPVRHFSPWDFNWPFRPPAGAFGPRGPRPHIAKRKTRKNCYEEGSKIECESQALGETIGLAGASHALHYQSDRTPGSAGDRTIVIPLTDAMLPPGLKRVDLEIFVAGRSIVQTFPNTANQSTTFTWDGKDAYGRLLQGPQPIKIGVGYVFGGVYATPSQPDPAYEAAFGHYSFDGLPATADATRREITVWRRTSLFVGGFDTPALALGGWSFSPHHVYDQRSRTIFFGDGSTRSATAIPMKLTSLAGHDPSGQAPPNDGDGLPARRAVVSPWGIAAGPDGSIFVASLDRIRRVRPDGIIEAFAGVRGQQGFSGDGGPATQARMNARRLAVGRDGSVYFIDDGSRIRRITPDGIVRTVAGNGSTTISGDGGPATSAGFFAASLVVGPDGALYIGGGPRIRRVSPDGIITTYAGSTAGLSGDGGVARNAQFNGVSGLAFGPDGALYVADYFNNRIRRIDASGVVTTVAGTFYGYAGDGGPAIQGRLSYPNDVAVLPDGTIVISDKDNFAVRAVSPQGTLTTWAGKQGSNGIEPIREEAPASDTSVGNIAQLAVGPDGLPMVGDFNYRRIRQIAPTLPGAAQGDLYVPSGDASLLYVFNADGRHLRTVDAQSGVTRLTFGYDATGRLVSVTDEDGLITAIERDANTGAPKAILGPYGDVTTLALHPDGFLKSATNAASQSVALTYKTGFPGLLETLTDPRGHVHSFQWDPLGRLTKDVNPAGGSKTLTPNVTDENNWSVALTSELGRTATRRVENLSDGTLRRTTTSPAGLNTVVVATPNGRQTITQPDGTTMTTASAPDPRFGMAAPFQRDLSISTPGGVVANVTVSKTATLTDPNNLLSLATLTEAVNVNGKTFTTVEDYAARTTTTTTAAGRRIVVGRDAKWRPIRMDIQGFASPTAEYDNKGRLWKITVGSRVWTVGFDAAGNAKTLTDPANKSVVFDFDAVGRVTKATLPDPTTVHSRTHDASGNVQTVTPPGRSAHTFTYHPGGLPFTYVPPAAPNTGTNTWTTLFNKDQQFDKQTAPDGREMRSGYDAAGRLRTFTDARGVTTYTYVTTTGNLDNVTSPGGVTTSFVYDGALEKGTAWAGPVAGSVARELNNNFAVREERVNGADPISFTYDDDGWLTGAGAMTVTPEPAFGVPKATTLGSVTDDRTLDTLGARQSYVAKHGQNVLYSAQYTTYPTNLLETVTETVLGQTRVWRYVYDEASRLKEVYRDGVQQARWVYHPNGNREQEITPGGTTTGTYDAQDRLTAWGSATYAYDAAGALKTITSGGQTTTYEYDLTGDLAKVTLPNNTVIEYVHDYGGRRIGKRVNGTLAKGFLYRDALKPLAELDGNGAVVSRFVYGTTELVPDYMIRGGVNYRIISDRQRSVRLVVDSSTGTVAQRIDYDALGNITLDTNPGFQPFGFAGGLYDPDTKLVRFGARDYDPQTGRWTSKDPSGFGGDEGNLYAYCHNDPVNFVDPNGHNALLAAGPLLGFMFFALLAYYLLVLQYSKGKPVKPPQIVRPVMQRLEWLIIYGLSKYLGNDNGPQSQPQAGAGDGNDCPPYENFIKIDPKRIKYKPSARGRAPIGDDGEPIELHHLSQEPLGEVGEMTQTDHRRGENFKKNHQNTGQDPSKIDRRLWKKCQEDYWKREWDSGRFDNLPEQP